MSDIASQQMTRRELITAGLATTLLSAIGVRAATSVRIFDSHVHVTSSDSVRYPPDPVSGVLKPEQMENPLTGERLIKSMDAVGIDRAVLTQRLHVYGFDNRYVIDCVKANPDRLVAVCGVDGRDPKAGERARYWVKDQGAVGLRLTEPNKETEVSAWLSGTAAQGIWRAVADLDAVLVLHFLRTNRNAGLDAIQPLIKQFPKLKIVLDHASNLVVEEGAPNFGLDALLTAVAKSPNIYFKVSTINLNAIDKASLQPSQVLARLVAEVGHGRVMWGSDAGNSQGDLSQMSSRILSVTATLPAATQAAILHDTAKAVFGSARKRITS